MDLKINTNPESLPRGQQFTVFVPGVDTYSAVRLRQEVDLVGPEGVRATATVRSRRFGTLYDLLQGLGPMSYSAMGNPYDISLLIDDLEATYPDEPDIGHVSKIYTVIAVDRLMPVEPPPMPNMFLP